MGKNSMTLLLDGKDEITMDRRRGRGRLKTGYYELFFDNGAIDVCVILEPEAFAALAKEVSAVVKLDGVDKPLDGLDGGAPPAGRLDERLAGGALPVEHPAALQMEVL